MRFEQPAQPKKKNYYEFFGVAQNATEEELRRAYRRKARLYHPDIGKTPEQSKQLTEQFKQLQEVYSILKDPQKRASYDETIRPKVTTPSIKELNDMIHDAFDFSKPFGSPKRKSK